MRSCTGPCILLAMDFDALWSKIDGPTLAGDWTEGSVLDPGPTEAAAPALPIIDLDEDFEIDGVLGRGGNGVVMAARQRSLDRTVAIKVLSEEGNARAATALLAEARSAGMLEHPNVVPIHALGQDRAGRPVMIMKRLAGITWSTLLRDLDHPIGEVLPSDPIDRHLHIAFQVIAAVSHAHRAGVVHRDIKPGNVMIGPGGEVCLVDWGLAQRAGERARGPAGTPGFMPPEMLAVEVTVDPRTDVYLLGATLYAALTGTVPHRGGDLATVLRSTATGEIEIPASLPAELGELLAKAMAARPADRFATVADLRSALQAFDAHREADRLCGEADVHRARISAENAERATAFGAATFGYQAALDRWPASPRARAGLRAARLQMVEALLTVGHLDSAARLLGTVDVAPASLRTRLDASLAAQTREAAEVAQLKDAVDTVAGYRGRRWMFPILTVLAVVGPLVMGVLRLLGRLDSTGFAFKRAIAPTVVGVLLLSALLFSRRAGLRQAFNRRLLGVLGFLILTVGLSFASGGLLGLSVPQILARNLLLNAFSATIVAVLLSQAFIWVAILTWIAAFAASAQPQIAELLMGCTNGATLFTLWFFWQRRAAQAASRDAEDGARSAQPERGHPPQERGA